MLLSNLNLGLTGKVVSGNEATSTTTKTTSYIYAGGLVASYDSDGNEKYYINDHLGWTSKVIDKNGNVVASEEYYAFGEEKTSAGDEKFTYTGKELDDTGFYYYGARYYDADVGRFISVDPIPSMNKYIYTLNNPLKYTDPSGMAVSYAKQSYAPQELEEKYESTEKKKERVETLIFYSVDILLEEKIFREPQGLLMFRMMDLSWLEITRT